MFVFYFCIFRNKLDLFKATYSTIVALTGSYEYKIMPRVVTYACLGLKHVLGMR